MLGVVLLRPILENVSLLESIFVVLEGARSPLGNTDLKIVVKHSLID